MNLVRKETINVGLSRRVVLVGQGYCIIAVTLTQHFASFESDYVDVGLL
jgi:hypothetical protein